MKLKIIILLSGTLLLILVTSDFVYIFAIQNGNIGYPPLYIKESDRVMIIAPHPDDEAISSAGIIRYCTSHNIPVKVVIITNGGFNLAWQRHSESLKAMKQLGLVYNITFLDYPQGLIHLLTQNWDKPYVDSNGISHSINKFSHNLNAPYTGESLAKQLEDVIYDFKPTIIIYPDSNDIHEDHWVTSGFVEYAMTKLNYNCTTLGYIVHTPSNTWPTPHFYFPDSYLTPPSYLSKSENWVEFRLTGKSEELKASAIKSYKSQLKRGSYYLLSFVKKNELFSVQRPINVTRNSNIIFTDPENDVKKFDNSIETEMELSNNSIDLTSISFEAGENGTCLSLQTKGKISTTDIYEFHLLIIFRDNTTNDIDIEVKNGKYHINHGKLSNLTIFNTQNGIIIETPIIFKRGDKVILSADAIKPKKGIDTTPWQIIEIA
ncbi:MAG: PIG-L family deacetylase [Methanothermobacter sp.]|nr:PIG-L family deacetylase [Methanothermobacter sp.]